MVEPLLVKIVGTGWLALSPDWTRWQAAGMDDGKEVAIAKFYEALLTTETEKPRPLLSAAEC